jgi:hypothetical protein
VKTFRDTTGREWAIKIDVAAIKRVMKAPLEYEGEPLHVNLLALVEPESELLKKLIVFPPLICDIAYALCQPQCIEKKVSDEEFGQAMGGDTLETVLDLILEETVDFFPPARRKVYRTILEKSRTFAEKAKELTTAQLEAGELEKAIDAVLEPELKRMSESLAQTTVTGTVGNSPESSESIPAPEHSAN